MFWQRVIWTVLALGAGSLSMVTVKGDPALGATMAGLAGLLVGRAFQPMRRVIKPVVKPPEKQV